MGHNILVLNLHSLPTTMTYVREGQIRKRNGKMVMFMIYKKASHYSWTHMHISSSLQHIHI